MGGFLIGTLLSGIFCDKYGRRPTLIGAYIGAAVFGLLPICTARIYPFMILRFFNGVSCGMGVLSAVYSISGWA